MFPFGLELKLFFVRRYREQLELRYWPANSATESKRLQKTSRLQLVLVNAEIKPSGNQSL